MLTRHPLTVLVACVVAAAGVAAGVMYMLTSRRRRSRASSPMPMVTGMTASKAETVIRSATGVSRIDVEQVSAGAPKGTVVTQTPVPGMLVSRSVQIRLGVAADPGEPA